ncbi:ABC-type branched-chain amino acid transport system, permease component [Synechococcus sp. PCC 7502]|uniref:branched-chain amino acid ABC transporter permease n=1 Tax=Synechococcus sp. PCC 7502 TaxID=1173263 RepID=UPI00029FD6AA|nr:branched-chain amino acid ABC transporter permease [Synechococcus sp. PCC 7502]AFY74943.1 ABC-type branched-chain amino acid transport system, permease component [Synechococcus sp. PCC 7502]
MFFFNSYGFLLVSMLLGALLGMSVYLPLMTGQLSLASPGFYALGGYVAAIMSTKVIPADKFSIWLLFAEISITTIACGLLAILLGFPVLRLRGIYLAIATIAFVEILRVLSLNLEITGGAVGIFGIPQPFGSQIGYLWIVVPLLVVSMILLYRIEVTKLGRVWRGIREDELAAGAIGINSTNHKVLAFTIGAVLAGIVGVISAHFLNTWNARQGTFDASITYLAFVLAGGSRTFIGPVVGGIALTALPEVLRAIANINGLPKLLSQFLQDGRLIIFGTLIVLATIFFPKGLITPELLSKLLTIIRTRVCRISSDH